MTLDLYAIRRYSAWANTDELGKVGIKSAKVGDEEMPSDEIYPIVTTAIIRPDSVNP